jgi:flagellar biosynthesis chaperone FliJ
MTESVENGTPPGVTWPQRLSKYAWIALQSGAAVVVAYVFVILLLVGTAQQRVDEALAKENVGYDYSVAIRYFLDSSELTKRAEQKSKEVRDATTTVRNANRRVAAAERQLEARAVRLRQTVNALSSTCGLAGSGTSANAQDLLSAAAAVQDCNVAADAVGGASPAAQIAGPQQDFEESLDNVDFLKDRVEDQQTALKLLEAQRDAINEQINAAAKSGSILEILRIFDQSDLLLSVPLIRMPPTLTGVILTFISGMFGALLITLVLFVYPDQNQPYTQSDSYFGRILLGGLVALGVFVLLFSGVAVLAGSEGSGNAQNLIAYSAIGLLAGMFSDQAAKWIHSQSIFGAKSGNGLPATPPPPPATAPPPPPAETPIAVEGPAT